MSGPVVQGPVVQGWCPGALRPMLSGDGLVVRVRLHGGRLPKAVALRLADLSESFGNGLIDLSARGNLQLRGVTEAGHGALVAELDALGLIDADAQAEAMRNVLVTPFWSAGDGAQEIAAELVARLGEFPALPGKFGYGVDTGRRPVLRESSADVRIEQVGDDLVVWADGTETGAVVTRDTVVDAVLELVRWFVAAGGISEGRGRMAGLIARGAMPPERFRAVPIRRFPPFRPDVGRYGAGYMVGFDFGQVQAETLSALADDCGDLRMTPWRMLYVEQESVPEISGMIRQGNEAVLRVAACTGAPACLQGLRPVRDLARRLAPFVPRDKVLHVSGCAKGCAHPAAADVTLVATAAGFDVIRGGTAADAGVAAMTAEELLARPEKLTESFDAP